MKPLVGLNIRANRQIQTCRIKVNRHSDWSMAFMPDPPPPPPPPHTPHTHARTHARTHTRARAHTHTHTHTKLVSNWILMSCQPHRVTSGQSNSSYKQMHISQFFSYIYKPFVKNQSLHKHKTKHTYTNIRVSPFSISPVKRAHKARTCCYR